MKASKYNYIFYDESYSYWFQGISRNFFRLEKELGKRIAIYMSERDKINELKEGLPHFYERLVSTGFIVDDCKDELNYIMKKREEFINSKDYFLIILPTLNCNFKCWYCIQDHIPSSMSSSTIEKVKKHIEQKIKKEKITSLHIEWFGGEPFMFFKKVIKPISQYALKICEEHGVNFSNTSTTNGFLINKKLHTDLVNLKFERFQITLDGNRSIHNSVKFQKNKYSAFDMTLKNINGLLGISKRIKILLRINYTKNNLGQEIIEQVNEHIAENFRERVTVVFRKVWQEKMDNNVQFKLYELMDKFQEAGYNVRRIDVVSDFITCYVEKKYYNAINFNGSIVKCTAHDDLYSEDPPGYLTEKGDIIWRKGKNRDTNQIDKQCIPCTYLPICMGSCPRDREENGENFRCKMKHINMSLDKMIVNFINSQY